MQKQNPVLLASGLVVMVLLIAIGNYTGFFQDPGRFFAKAPEPPKPAETPKVSTKAETAMELQKAQDKMKTRGGPRGPGGEMGEELINGVPKEPSIMIKEVVSIKPTVNDSNISSQWYREGSRQKDRSDKMLKERSGQ